MCVRVYMSSNPTSFSFYLTTFDGQIRDIFRLANLMLACLHHSFVLHALRLDASLKLHCQFQYLFEYVFQSMLSNCIICHISSRAYKLHYRMCCIRHLVQLGSCIVSNQFLFWLGVLGEFYALAYLHECDYHIAIFSMFAMRLCA